MSARVPALICILLDSTQYALVVSNAGVGGVSVEVVCVHDHGGGEVGISILAKCSIIKINIGTINKVHRALH